MTRNIEDLIRSAQELQADRAVSTDRIRAALPSRVDSVRRRRRFSMLGATVATAVVAAAVTIPAVALRGAGPAPTTPPVASTPSPAVNGQVALPEQAPLAYRPAWVPAGFAERIRQNDVVEPGDDLGPTLVRVWKKQVGAGDPWSGAAIELYVRTATADPARAMDTSGQQVDVNGARGYYSASHGDGKSSVSWSPGGHTALMVTTSHVEVSRADLLRIARSVRPDPADSTIPVRLRWLPTGFTAIDATVSGPSVARWRAEISAVRRAVVTDPAKIGKDKRGAAPSQGVVMDTGTVSVVVGSSTDAPPGGVTLTVGDRPARHPVLAEATNQGLIYLVVDLGQGRLMTLIGQGDGLTLNDLTKIASRAEIVPAAAEWLGS